MDRASIVLFAVAALLGTGLAPFNSADTAGALMTGMSLVAAMAIQNAVHRTHFSQPPPTTLMTGSTTQIMMDLADLMGGKLSGGDRAVAVTRSATLSGSVWVFALGCGVAALIYARLGATVLLVPPVIATMTLVARFR
jgi:uncharacterized membrane protein YoaK (UPF0700 family)